MNLVVSHIRKAYAEKTVLADCTARFDQRGVYVLQGQNGSGKSTFLRICALLEPADNGVVSFFSERNEPLPLDLALRRRMTLVLPRTGIFDATVFQNAVYGLKLRGLTRAEQERQARRALGVVGLDGKTRQRALTLSSGESQRLGIARALAIDPEILFLDEPTASVDQENTELIEAVIATMKQEGRTTIILTTHDADQAERLADARLVLHNGVIEEARG